MIELGERLTRVASFVPNGLKVCDVGSDHAYLPVYLIQNDQITSAIAGEVVEGPFYQRSKQFEIIEWKTASKFAWDGLADSFKT